MQGQQDIQVVDSDIDGLNLAIVGGVDVVGTIQSDGGKRPIALINLTPAGEYPGTLQTPAGVLKNFGGEGKFTIPGLLPGSYLVHIFSSAYIASTTYGATDLLHGGLLTLKPGTPPEQIQIVLGSGGGRVSGKCPPSEKWQTVLLVPASGAAALVGSAEHGTFAFSNVAPGDDRAFLLPQNTTFEYLNPDVLRAWGGEIVHVSEGATTQVELKELAKPRPR
jgi:hypothetical protein